MTPERLAFIQRAGEKPAPLAGVPVSGPTRDLTQAFRIAGLSREDGHSGVRSTDTAGERPPVTLPLLSALHTYAIPLAFSIGRSRGRVSVSFGTWSGSSASTLRHRAEVLRGLLSGIAPEVEVAALDPGPTAVGVARIGGYLLGVPSQIRPTAGDPAAVWDRVFRITGSASWTLTVVARPVSEQHVLDLRLAALNEARDATTALDAKVVSRPLAEAHLQLTKAAVDSLTSAVAIGAWRTAVYLITEGGDTEFAQVASALRGLLTGNQSQPEPIRVFPDAAVADLSSTWSLAEVAGPAGPGLIPRPYEYQTMLNSSQLAAYVQLPELETAGFRVRKQARFDRVPRPIADRPSIRIGGVWGGDVGLHGAEPTEYRLEFDQLTKHVFVPGVTGSGKTNTIFHLLGEVSSRGVPFLVLEPAKTEYRALIDPQLVPEVTVYTVGREDVAPLRLNPFEVIPHQRGAYDVASHIDRLRALFVACFGLWNPLPAILEQALYRVYTDRGWDMRVGTNLRLAEGADPRAAFPTMTDLARVIADVINDLGYDQEVTDNMRGALAVRINAMRLGAKGRMLDGRLSVPFDDLFKRPVVVELEGLGDEDDKAFLMGLFLIQLAAYRRAAGRSNALQHVLVVEEAHRLLRNVTAKGGAEENNSAFKAVESFGNLLAEVRAYGQAVIVADQVPTGLAPVVMKNTNLKIVHRLVSADDREAVGATMAMNAAQIRHLTTLPVGRTAVFTEGEDNALLVDIDKVPAHDKTIPDEILLNHASPPPSDCPGDPGANGRCCGPSIALIETAAFRAAYSRAATAAFLPGALDRVVGDIRDLLTAAAAPGIPTESLAQCVAGRAASWLADRRGSSYGWDFDANERCRSALNRLLPGNGVFDTPRPEDQVEYAAAMVPLHQRTLDPFPGCSQICRDRTCFYRGAVLDLLDQPSHLEDWRASGADLLSMWSVADTVSAELADDDSGELVRPHRRSGSIRAALCFAQHAARAANNTKPSVERADIAALINHYGLDVHGVDPEES